MLYILSREDAQAPEGRGADRGPRRARERLDSLWGGFPRRLRILSREEGGWRRGRPAMPAGQPAPVSRAWRARRGAGASSY
jgi:hypothetical protein